ncbi:MAG: hypothetical protein P8J32_04885 [bacterium]|nr:hypothetical protein [bacterium]
MINVYTTSDPKKQEAFWYHGQQIATVTMPDGTIFSMEASGEIQCTITELKHKGVDRLPLTGDEKTRTLRGHESVAYASVSGLTDEDLKDDELIVFDMNNWFAIRELKPNTTEGPDDDFAICHTYTDGIQELMGILLQA